MRRGAPRYVIILTLDRLYSGTNHEILQGFDRALEQSSDAIRAKASWLKRDRGDVESWLAENGYLSKSGEKL